MGVTSPTALTPQTISAMRKVFSLLEDNFNPETGAYLGGWSDQRIAEETGVSLAGVKKYRAEGFGKLKPPSEIMQLKQDLEETQGLFVKSEQEIKEKLADFLVVSGEDGSFSVPFDEADLARLKRQLRMMRRILTEVGSASLMQARMNSDPALKLRVEKRAERLGL
jgi:hypothetical protein